MNLIKLIEFHNDKGSNLTFMNVTDKKEIGNVVALTGKTVYVSLENNRLEIKTNSEGVQMTKEQYKNASKSSIEELNGTITAMIDVCLYRGGFNE